MDVVSLEAEFTKAMQEIYRRAKTEAGYNATVFLRMLQDRGALETARYLIHTAKPSDGFTALWEKGPLDLTVEAHVLQPRFDPLFTDEERTICSQRLEALGYTPPTT
jgi:hypothetical protein